MNIENGFQKVRKALRYAKCVLRYVISNFLYRNKCRTILTDEEEAVTEMWFFRQILRIPMTEYMSTLDVSMEIESTGEMILTTTKGQFSSGIYNDERRYGEFNTHETYRRSQNERETECNLISLC